MRLDAAARAQAYYVWAIEYNGILLTLVSMAVFWLDATNCGERLGFGVTTLLAVQVTKNWTSALVPTCGEFLWIEIVLLVNELFCVVSLLVSCVAVRQAFKGQGTVDELSSNAVDMIARRVIPPVYVVALAVLYNIDMEDGYFGTLNPMFQGLATGKDSKLSLKWSVVVAPLCVLFAVVTYLAAKRTGTSAKVNRFVMKLGNRFVREIHSTDADHHGGHGGHGGSSSTADGVECGAAAAAAAASEETSVMALPVHQDASHQLESIHKLLKLLEDREERAALSDGAHAQPPYFPNGGGGAHHQHQHQHQHQQSPLLSPVYERAHSAHPAHPAHHAANGHVGASPGVQGGHAQHVLNHTCYAMGHARMWGDPMYGGGQQQQQLGQQLGAERSAPAGYAPGYAAQLHPAGSMSAEPMPTPLAAIPAGSACMRDGLSPANSVSSSAGPSVSVSSFAAAQLAAAAAANGNSHATPQRSTTMGGRTLMASARELPSGGGGGGGGARRLSPKDMAWEAIKRSCEIKNELDARGVRCELDKHSTPIEIGGEVVKVRVPHGSFARQLLDGHEPMAFGAKLEELFSAVPLDVRALDEFLMPRVAAGKDGAPMTRI